MKSKRWAFLFLILSILLCSAVTGMVLWIDPFFHFHKPYTDSMHYEMDVYYQRYFNAGIIRNFDYDSMIIGTSLTEFFHTSEAEDIMGGSFVKVPFSGASWAEICDNILLAEENHRLRTVIRPLDFRSFGIEDSRYITDDYPLYLYDRNPFNDIRYIFNKETLYVCTRTLLNTFKTRSPGITSFDDYCNWDTVEFSRERALNGITEFPEPSGENHLSEAEKTQLIQNIQDNIIRPAELYPETEFYCFIPPYSIVSWGECRSRNDLARRFEAEELLLSMLAEQENIHLFSFAAETDWTTDLENYCDITHYSPKLNTLILQAMKEGDGRLTSSVERVSKK